MKRLGTVSSIDGQGKLVIRAAEGLTSGSLKDLPRIGSVVMDQKVKRIGKVSSVIGPVSSPYVVVKVAKSVSFSELKACVNQKLYVK
ncbi:RNA-binding protein [Methanohalophilus levihalophilus]|uniref:H/ACA ribonucleoprotein complex subunit GAR1 n=1 Tax=Methanohalophilus levihalophilus TaxID=1431282 RepID=UPI001AE792C4|nr:Gar1/Naf1 family protein [Methanohalophilus levihalophilus]MBP2031171.1 RNA-binding protein [Methanohalophilus levihalophilus]